MSEARRHLAQAQRIVVKLGTHVVTDDGVELALERITDIIEGVARLRRAGREVVMVSSGAVTMGVRALGLSERPRSLGLRQACAAVGQGLLMGVYSQLFAKRGITAAQVLLTQEDLADRDRALCVRTTLTLSFSLSTGTAPSSSRRMSVVRTQRARSRSARSSCVRSTCAAVRPRSAKARV